MAKATALKKTNSVSPDPESEEIVKQLQTIGKELHVDLSRSPDDLLDGVTHRVNNICQQTAIMGLELLAAKATLPHGSFTHELNRRGLKHTTVHRAMSIAKMLIASDSKKRAELINAAPTKLIKLAKFDNDELDELCEESNTDIKGVLAFSRTELERLLKDHEKNSVAQAEQINDLKTAIADANGAAAWEQHSRRIHKGMDEELGRMQNRMSEIIDYLNAWRHPPKKSAGKSAVHGRAINGHINQMNERLKRFKDAAANFETEYLRGLSKPSK